MAEIVTYNSPLTGNPNMCFCQMRFDDGVRILISQSREGIKVFKLIFGICPIKTLFKANWNEYDKFGIFINGQNKHPLILDHFVDTIKEIRTGKQFYEFLKKNNL